MRQSRQRTTALRQGMGSGLGLRVRRWLGVASCALLTSLPVAAAGLFDRAPAVPVAAPNTLAPIEVRDLHYGDVLFEFYNGDLPNALLKLRVYEAQGLLRHHADDAKLLLGGLYLSQGQHLEAGRLFAEVLDRPGVPPTVRDRARFLLGKVWYQRGYYAKAEQALRQTGNTLEPEWAAERQQWLAQALLQQGKFDEASALLSAWNAPSEWRGYAGFNLGVALVRAGRMEEGLRQLEVVGNLASERKETAALRDKAWLAAGSALLKAGEAERARLALERVRLDGPFSTRALLASGWAYAALGQYDRALVPWLELQGHSVLDAAVQESYLAVPEAYSRLGADAQAAEQYEAALQAFAAEKVRLAESITALRQGRLLQMVSGNEGRALEGWLWHVRQLPDLPESRYLPHLLASHDFQEALKNYRSMLSTEQRLDAADRGLEAFREMVALRRDRFANWLPPVLAKTDLVDLQKLHERATGLTATLGAAQAERDGTALATAREQATWAKLMKMEATFAARPGDPDLADAREDHRLLKGVMQWNLSAAMKSRAFRAQRGLTEAQAALALSARARLHVNESRELSPARYADYESRINTLQPRLLAMQGRLREARLTEERFLSLLAVRELEAQQARLVEYEVRARYALAAIYDRAGAGKRP